MKKTFFILAAVSVAFFASCGGETVVCPDCPEIPEIPEVPETPELPESVANTYWAAESAWGDRHELTVTATDATYVFKAHGGYRWVECGPYTYEKPALTFSINNRLGLATITGTVTDEETMSIEISGLVRAAAGAITLKKRDPKQALPPAEPTLIGDWRLMSGAEIKDGIRREWDDGTTVYTFKENNSGWLYGGNDFQHSFTWRKIDEENICVSGWRWELDDISIDIDPRGYIVSEEWSILQLAKDKLVLSYLLIPVEGFESETEGKPITVELGLEREL